MNGLSILVLGLLLFVGGCTASKASPTPEPATPTPIQQEIVIKPAEVQQTLDGFGASGAWWAQDVGGWEDEKRERIVQLLFDREEGIGLSVYRYNIGGGNGENIQDPWRRAETFEVSRGEYDWSRDANAMWVLKAARDAGVEHFVAFANSPPARMTISGLTTGEKDGKTNLPPEMYDEFAQYLVDVVRHLREDEGIPIGWVSPVNEPQWSWNYENGQEGCHYGPAEVAAVTKALIKAIQASGLDIEASVFESGEWKSTAVYVDKLLDDPEIAPFIGHLDVHSYWSDENDKRRLVSYLEKYYPGTRLWMSEWTEMKEGRDKGMESALLLANTVHEDLTVGGVTSWQYWIAVSRYFYRDGLIYVNLTNRAIAETKRLWAMGNFSRYVRPGYARVEAESSLDSLNVTAFGSPDQAQLVLVVINNAAQAAPVRLNGVPAAYTQVAAYETGEENDLAQVYAGTAPETFTFAPLSVTTLVYQKP